MHESADIYDIIKREKVSEQLDLGINMDVNFSKE